MAVCACGNTMLKSEPWCKRCWSSWSVWFMRAGGKWIDLERSALLTSTPCECENCLKQSIELAFADRREERSIARFA